METGIFTSHVLSAVRRRWPDPNLASQKVQNTDLLLLPGTLCGDEVSSRVVEEFLQRQYALVLKVLST